MWLKTVDGDLVNMDQLTRIGRLGGDGAVVLWTTGPDAALERVGEIDEATWQRLQRLDDFAVELIEPPPAPHARKKP